MEPNRYQQGKIYKIISPHTDKIYIGSTTKQYLSQRLTKHKSHFLMYEKHGKGSNMGSFVLLRLGDVEIILLETYPCNSREELVAREKHWMEQYNNLVNKSRPVITEQERKEHKKQYALKKYNYTNEKHICECGGEYTTQHITTHERTQKHQTYLMIQTL